MNSDKQYLENLSQTHQRRLRVLEQQAAQFGAHTPPHIITEIEDIQAEIAEIDRQLGATAPSGIRAAPSAAIPAANAAPPPQALPWGASHAQRCGDLAASIQETLELLRQYEEQRRLSDSPKERRRAEREITDLRAQLAGYEREQRELGCS